MMLEPQAGRSPALPHLRGDEDRPCRGGQQGRHLPWQDTHPQAGVYLTMI